ncbi:hypothetical protein [Calycomorphotria hydatis]|uniref:Uncharacterized protein n=1 Tax=Calycomorphotria hydatis TaxID=2528027 RepID=A0A517TCI1_9PLAN|nr:hypothetical protein [Calycomorphotria hydatis]QDT66073.1 hypothetical protein V22_33370 [Calycomorphotria hydatis]
MSTFRTVSDDQEILFIVEQLFDAYDGSMLGYYVVYFQDKDNGHVRHILKDPEGVGCMVFSSTHEARNFAPALIQEDLAAH